jgi:hypothetical protein
MTMLVSIQQPEDFNCGFTVLLTALTSLQVNTICLPVELLGSQHFNNNEDLMEGVKT